MLSIDILCSNFYSKAAFRPEGGLADSSVLKVFQNWQIHT
jgi:hypothetical protein